MATNKKYYLTALVLYLVYICHGIGVSILSQYKANFAEMWGADKLADGTFDVSMVLTVIAALGLGRLISLPISGPFSDRFGRRSSGLIGLACYITYFFGIVFSPNMYVGYVFAVLGGVANSFIDTCIYPSIMEIFKEKGQVGNLFVKFSVSFGQLILPFMIGFVAANNMTFRTNFFVGGTILIICAVLLAFLPFPPMNEIAKNKEGEVKKEKIKWTGLTFAIILIGFTSTSTFQLWLNCNQELGKMYGMSDPSKIQTFYSIGTICAILLTAYMINKKILKPTQILILYPIISSLMLLICYFVQVPGILYLGGFVLGYAAAGGLLQIATSLAVEFSPTNGGKMTSLVMICSSLANYIILTAAGWITKAGGLQGPRYILLFNLVITLIGMGLALYVHKKSESTVSENAKSIA